MTNQIRKRSTGRQLLRSIRAGARLYLRVRTERRLRLVLHPRSDLDVIASDFAAVGADLFAAIERHPLNGREA